MGGKYDRSTIIQQLSTFLDEQYDRIDQSADGWSAKHGTTAGNLRQSFVSFIRNKDGSLKFYSDTNDISPGEFHKWLDSLPSKPSIKKSANVTYYPFKPKHGPDTLPVKTVIKTSILFSSYYRL